MRIIHIDRKELEKGEPSVVERSDAEPFPEYSKKAEIICVTCGSYVGAVVQHANQDEYGAAVRVELVEETEE